MTVLQSRPARRLLVALLVLVVVDIAEPGVLHELETARYEDQRSDFRLENSDLFGVGPLVSYLREYPRGRQPRVVFFGNSITYGYGLRADQAVPGQFQRLGHGDKVLNVGVNGFEAGSAWLVAKAAIDSIDEAYLLSRTEARASPLIPSLLPVTDDDRHRFGLPAPTSVEARLSSTASAWRLYRDTYRLQAALFGTSARQYLYLNKGRLARVLVAGAEALDQPANAGDLVQAVAPIAPTVPDAGRLRELRRASPAMLWDYAELFTTHRKPVALLQVPGYAEWLTPEAVADFNRAFHPYARVIVLQVAKPLTLDGLHLTEAGAAAVARALWRERDAYRAARP